MRRIYLFVILVFTLISGVKAQNYNWITPGQTYLKMYVADDGIYRIDKNDFINAGISVSGIDPRTIKLYYNGNQIPIYFNGEQDGVFNDTDYFDFYGQRNYGGITKTYDVYDAVNYTTDEYYNLYSDTSCYFIGWGGSYGVRFIDFSHSVSDPYPYDYYYKRIHFELDSVYSLGETFDQYSDYRNFLNDKFQGEGWYWRRFLYNNIHNSIFLTPFLPASSPPVKFKIFAYPEVVNTSIANEQILAVKVNGNNVDTIRRNDFGRMDTTLYFPKSYLNTSSNTLTMRYSPPSTASACKLLLDMVDIFYPSEIRIDTSKLSFKTELSDTSSKLFSVNNYNSGNQIYIYDIVNNKRIVNNTSSGSVLNFTGNGNGQFEIVNTSITKKPPRVKQRQVPNLVSNSTGVDYLVVYNKLFETPAEQLRSFRATKDGFRTFKAEIEDIYDVFNFGMENPVAVRNFIKNVYDVWATPKVEYLVLFGRGSIDPKNNFKNGAFYKNLLPVYGNPVSDVYFGNFTSNSLIYKTKINLGRIPCYTLQEGQDAVTKIIAYENKEQEEWSKMNLMITGGYYKSDQSSNAQQSESFISNYTKIKPNYLVPNKIYILDTLGLLTYNYSDSIIKSFSYGSLIANYIGHSGNNYWDYAFTDPVVLNNNNKYPLVMSMACFTGKIAEPNFRGYGEKFLYYPDKGAIGFISTTGWSWSSSGSQFNEYCWKGFRDDTLRRAGEFVKYSANLMDTISFAARNTINCYTLIGDPAVNLKLPKYPEFVIGQNDFTCSNLSPQINENVNIVFKPMNWGIYSDSCKVRIQLFKNNSVIITKDYTLYNFGYKDSINYNFLPDSIGKYSCKISLDPENLNTKENESNNVLMVNLNVKNYSFVEVSPINNQLISNDTVNIRLLNPCYNFYGNQLKAVVLVDTSNNFSSPLLQSFINQNISGVKTQFNFIPPINDSNMNYFWKVCTINNNDTVGWSNINRFKVKNELANPDTILKFKMYLPSDFQSSIFNNVNAIKDSIVISKFTGELKSNSLGENPWDPSYMIVNSKAFYFITAQSNVGRAGMEIFKIDKSTGVVIKRNHFYFNSSTSNDSVLQFLSSFDTSNILMACKLIPIGATTNLTTVVRDKFKEFGSTQIDNVNLLNWGTWSLISYKKNPGAIFSEAYNSGYVNSTSILTPEFQGVSGNLSAKSKTSQYYKSLSWQQELFPKTAIKTDIYGIKRDNTEQLLFQDLTLNNGVSLDTVNAYIYPNLKIVTKLSIDTSSGPLLEPIPYGGIPSPILKSISYSYVPPSELAIDYSSLVRSDSLINAEDSLGIAVRYFNVGFKNCYGTVRNLYFYRGNERINISSDTNYATLKVDSSQSYKTYIKFANYLPPTRKYDEQISVFFEVMPLGQQNDYYYYNNTINTDVWVKKNISGGTFELFADGVRLLGGEYVKKNPEVTVKYINKDAAPISFADTSLFKFIVNGRVINIGLNKEIKTIEDFTKRSKQDDKIINDAKSKQVEIPKSFNFYPELQNGENNLKILSRISYETNFDTLKYSVLVSDEFFVKDLYNYPNPTKGNTSFMFTLAGNNVTYCKIKIFTAAGRLIKTINTTAKIGYNQVFWDGRDDDGDALANGVYFYKLIVEGDGKKETPLQRLAVLR